MTSSAIEAGAIEASAIEASAIEASAIEPFVRMALACTEQAYPNQIAHRLDSDADARLPRELTPVFSRCYASPPAFHPPWFVPRAPRVLPGSPSTSLSPAPLDRILP